MAGTGYSVGSVVGVPVAPGLWGAAVVARWTKLRRGSKAVFLYALDGRHERCPALAEIGEPTACDAIGMDIQGDRAIHEGLWPVVGPLPGFREADWPMPPFESGGRVFRRDNPMFDFKYTKVSLPARLVAQLPPRRGDGNATWLRAVFKTIWLDGLQVNRIEISRERLEAWKEAIRLLDAGR